MKQYQDLLQKIINEGVEKESGRANMPNTIGISKSDIQHDMSNGFPLLTTKEMFWKGAAIELMWIMKGNTNIKYLVDRGVNYWNKNAYRWYEKQANSRGFDTVYKTIKDFAWAVKELGDYEVWDTQYKLGDLGKVYGYQWRNQNGTDQLAECLEGLQGNPFSRYHIIDNWNKSDFKDMALPPCHFTLSVYCKISYFKRKVRVPRYKYSS